MSWEDVLKLLALIGTVFAVVFALIEWAQRKRKNGKH